MTEYIFRYCNRCEYSTPTLTDRCSVCGGYLSGVTVLKKENKNLLPEYVKLFKNKI